LDGSWPVSSYGTSKRSPTFRIPPPIDGRSDEEIRAAMGDEFPKHIYHSIICIGALIARQNGGQRTIDAPHIGERSEKGIDLIIC
jgi:hypothetical protein